MTVWTISPQKLLSKLLDEALIYFGWYVHILPRKMKNLYQKTFQSRLGAGEGGVRSIAQWQSTCVAGKRSWVSFPALKKTKANPLPQTHPLLHVIYWEAKAI